MCEEASTNKPSCQLGVVLRFNSEKLNLAKSVGRLLERHVMFSQERFSFWENPKVKPVLFAVSFRAPFLCCTHPTPTPTLKLSSSQAHELSNSPTCKLNYRCCNLVSTNIIFLIRALDLCWNHLGITTKVTCGAKMVLSIIKYANDSA